MLRQSKQLIDKLRAEGSPLSLEAAAYIEELDEMANAAIKTLRQAGIREFGGMPKDH